MFSVFFLSRSSFTASVSVRNIRNIPKVPLTVKPDPNDTLNRSLNGAIGSNTNNYYYDTKTYSKPSDEMNSLYINGQAQQQGISIHQDALQHQYAVVKKTGSKRDIRDNLEREHSAVFKVRQVKWFIEDLIECFVLNRIKVFRLSLCFIVAESIHKSHVYWKLIASVEEVLSAFVKSLQRPCNFTCVNKSPAEC